MNTRLAITLTSHIATAMIATTEHAELRRLAEMADNRYTVAHISCAQWQALRAIATDRERIAA